MDFRAAGFRTRVSECKEDMICPESARHCIPEWSQETRCNIGPSTGEARGHLDTVLVKQLFHCAFEREPCVCMSRLVATSNALWCPYEVTIMHSRRSRSIFDLGPPTGKAGKYLQACRVKTIVLYYVCDYDIPSSLRDESKHHG